MEYATVGTLLCDPAAVGEVAGWLEPADFAQPACAAVYRSVLVLYAAGEPVRPGMLSVYGSCRGSERGSMPAHAAPGRPVGVRSDHRQVGQRQIDR